MLQEMRDFARFESRYGFRVLLNDLISVNKALLQEHYLDKILREANERHLKFTFFMSAKNLHRRKNLVLRMLKDGHEIASHGYHHLLLNALSYEALEHEFEISHSVFKELNLCIHGFRAPFLSFNKEVLRLLKRYNYIYSSNIVGGKQFSYKNGIIEIPIIKPYDWYGIVVEEKTIHELMQLWKKRNGCCYLFHPWIIDRYLPILLNLLGRDSDYRIISNLKKNRITFSFDVY
jgi:hypothetical protein